MSYILVFAVTYTAVFLFNRKFGTARLPLHSTDNGGFILHTDKVKTLFLFLLCALPLFLMSALREGIGTDYYYTYTPRFTEILAGERTYYEIGFYWFNRIVGLFTHNPQWIFITTSFIYCLFVFLAFYEHAEDLPFCIVILLVTGEYFASLNNLRQAMASAIMLFGYRFIKKKKWIHFAVLTLLASMLHKSMIIFLAVLALVFILKYIPLEKILIVGTVIVAAAFVLVNTSNELLELILPERLIYYIQNAIYTERTIGFIRTGLNIAILCVLLFTRQKLKETELDPFIIVQVLAVVVCLFDNFLPAAYRILRIFTFWQLLSIPIMVNKYRGIDRLILKLAFILVLGVLCFYSVVILGTEEILPYQWIFN